MAIKYVAAMKTRRPLGDASTGSMTSKPASGDRVNRPRSNSGDSIQPRLSWLRMSARASPTPRSSWPEDTPPDQGFAIPARSVAFIRGTPFDCLRGSGLYFREPKTGFQPALFVREVFDLLDGFSAHDLEECGGSKGQGLRHPQCGTRILADGLRDKFIGEANMGDFVGLLHLEQIHQFLIASFAGFVDGETHRIDSARFKAAVLYHQAAQEIAEIGDDPVLEIQNWVFPEFATPALEDAPEHFDMGSVVGALAGDRNAYLPVRVRKVGERLRGIFYAVQFLVHLAMKEFNNPQGVVIGKIGTLDPPALLGKTFIAGRSWSKQRGI